jgi:hypothetical protein
VKVTAFDLQLDPASPGMKFHKIDRARDRGRPCAAGHSVTAPRPRADIREGGSMLTHIRLTPSSIGEIISMHRAEHGAKVPE